MQKHKSNEFGAPCHFCDSGRTISTRFIEEASGACVKCTNSIPYSCNIHDRYIYLMSNAKYKKEIE
jgi:hypothetical protein